MSALSNLEVMDLDLDLNPDAGTLLPYESATEFHTAAPQAPAPHADTPAAHAAYAPAPAADATYAPPVPGAQAHVAPAAVPAAHAPHAPVAHAAAPHAAQIAVSADASLPVPQEQVTVAAQLLQYDRECFVALPVHTTIELLDQAPVVEVPGAAYYCNGLTRWRGQWLPVLDLHALVNAYRKEYAPKTRYLLIVAYQTVPRAPVRHGAIALPVLPGTVRVSDSAACELPSDSDLWPLLASSCFQIKGRAVPILDTGRLFGQYHG